MIQNAFIASNGLIVNGNAEINGDLTVSGFAYASSSYAITASYALSYSGTSGTSGANGSSGSTGASGTDGSSGTSGANGSSGASGTDGSSGSSGSTGTSGTDGSSGTSGANGSSGTDGSSGTSGTDGSSGTSGASGSSGSSGSSGNTGASGSGGSSGSSGTSGANGTSGSSGSSGISGGTSNYVAKFSAATTLTTSSIFDNATNVGIGTSSPNAKLDVYGDTIITGSLSVTGNITAIGNVTGQNLISSNASGNEGGEIQLAKSPNSTLSGSNIIIDQYVDRVRIFESGGSSRGAYLNVVSQSSGVGSEILTTTSTNILATPAWTSAGPITLTATTTNPTKGTTTSDNISYRRLGEKQWEIVMTYNQSSNTGYAQGTGDYLITLPNGLSFDTTLPSQPIYTSNVGTNTWAHNAYVIPNCNGLITNNTVGGHLFPMVYSATKFRILTLTYGSGILCWGSGFYSTVDIPKIQLSFRFTST